MKKKILVNFLTARVGGGKTYFREFCEFWKAHSQKFTDLEITIFTLESLDLPHAKVVSFQGKNFFSRLVIEQIYMPFYSLFHRMDLLYCTTDRIPFFTLTPVVALIRNANLYNLQKYGGTFLERVRVNLLRKLVTYSFKKSKGLIFVSQSIKNLAEQNLNLKVKNFSIIPHGFPSHMNLEPPQSSEPYLLYVSSIYYYKNFEDPIEALAKIDPKILSKFYIVGGVLEHNYFKKLSEKIKSLNLEGRVVFLGQINDRRKLQTLYQNAAVVCVTSTIESFGHPAFEGYTSGKPLLLSNIDVFQEFFEESETLKFYKIHDSEDCRRKILDLAAQKNLTPRSMPPKALSWEQCFINTFEFISQI